MVKKLVIYGRFVYLRSELTLYAPLVELVNLFENELQLPIQFQFAVIIKEMKLEIICR